MDDRLIVVHLTTVHHPLDPRIYWKQARSLADAGHAVTLIARAAGITELEGVDFVPLPDGSGPVARLNRQKVAQEALRRIKPDIIHFHDPELIPLVHRMREELGSRAIYDMHEDYSSRGGFEGKALERLESWAFEWLDHVILAEDAYERRLNRHSVRSTKILNYVLSHDRVQRPHQNPSITTLIYTGTISKERGLFHMLDLARTIKQAGESIEIKIVGICNIPKQRQQAEAIIERDGLDTVLSIHGWDQYVPFEEIAEAYRWADAGLMFCEEITNYLLSVPTKFYEYIHYGLPVIASNFPLWTSFLYGNGCGLTVNPADSKTILRHIKDIESSERFPDMVKATVSSRERYEWNKMAKRLFEVYDSLSSPLPAGY